MNKCIACVKAIDKQIDKLKKDKKGLINRLIMFADTVKTPYRLEVKTDEFIIKFEIVDKVRME
jgi:hypothetical protein